MLNNHFDTNKTTNTRYHLCSYGIHTYIHTFSFSFSPQDTVHPYSATSHTAMQGRVYSGAPRTGGRPAKAAGTHTVNKPCRAPHWHRAHIWRGAGGTRVPYPRDHTSGKSRSRQTYIRTVTIHAYTYTYTCRYMHQHPYKRPSVLTIESVHVLNAVPYTSCTRPRTRK